ncbi:hypothetical protein EVAR_9845_1 [Eumeta japonica]|uniref:Uncharacterized protein n=1 Tax=Eumeta variegata TaxID=151549 RepID=A0A4C1TQ94_EUMVA|nr:hypothetical protein EVAR_9845_1 [Eumeta japonica]
MSSLLGNEVGYLDAPRDFDGFFCFGVKRGPVVSRRAWRADGAIAPGRPPPPVYLTPLLGPRQGFCKPRLREQRRFQRSITLEYAPGLRSVRYCSILILSAQPVARSTFLLLLSLSNNGYFVKTSSSHVQGQSGAHYGAWPSKPSRWLRLGRGLPMTVVIIAMTASRSNGFTWSLGYETMRFNLTPIKKPID